MSIKKVVVACASFKGTLSSKAAGSAIARGLNGAGFQTDVVGLADGGEGLVESLSSQVPGAMIVGAPCRGPLQAMRTAAFAVLPRAALQQLHGNSANSPTATLVVIEMAASSGLGLILDAQRDPKIATTLGVGDQILAALEHQAGELEIILGLGGSATNDGGAGMAQALGARFLDSDGNPLPPGGAALLKLHRIDVSGINPRIGKLPVTVACDVRNPLCGPEGASHVYGKQKGGTPADLALLDDALRNYAEVIKRDLGRDVADIPGAGAAGGLGAGCLAFLNAKLKPGIDLVLDTIGFERNLAGAGWVITGEGMLDDQTLMGKAPAGVAERARRHGLPCIAIGGGIDVAHKDALLKVFRRLESLSEFAGSKSAAMREPARYLEALARDRAAEWFA